LAEELVKQGAEVIVTTRSPATIPGVSKVISGIDVQDNLCGNKLVEGLQVISYNY
jgi:hypothetical protein